MKPESRIEQELETADAGWFNWHVIGVVAFVSLWVWAVQGKSDVDAFLDSFSLLTVLVGPLMLLLAVYGLRGVQRSLRVLMHRGWRADHVADAAGFYRLAAAFALGCGFLATLVGLVVMLQNMSDPNAIGPAVAVAILPQLYGVVVALLCLVAAAVLTRRSASLGEHEAIDRLGRHSVAVAGVVSGAGGAAILLYFFITLLSVSELRAHSW